MLEASSIKASWVSIWRGRSARLNLEIFDSAISEIQQFLLKLLVTFWFHPSSNTKGTVKVDGIINPCVKIVQLAFWDQFIHHRTKHTSVPLAFPFLRRGRDKRWRQTQQEVAGRCPSPCLVQNAGGTHLGPHQRRRLVAVSHQLSTELRRAQVHASSNTSWCIANWAFKLCSVDTKCFLLSAQLCISE